MGWLSWVRNGDVETVFIYEASYPEFGVGVASVVSGVVSGVKCGTEGNADQQVAHVNRCVTTLVSLP